MDGVICSSCHSYLNLANAVCPGCGTQMIYEGDAKNVIDRLQPDCLIHRYDGSDMLEPAVILKKGRTNYKVATRLTEYAKPVSVPEHKVYQFNQNILSAVQGLRNERTAAMVRYEQQIQSHWKHLKQYTPAH